MDFDWDIDKEDEDTWDDETFYTRYTNQDKAFHYPDYHLGSALTFKNLSLALNPKKSTISLPPISKNIRWHLQSLYVTSVASDPIPILFSAQEMLLGALATIPNSQCLPISAEGIQSLAEYIGGVCYPLLPQAYISKRLAGDFMTLYNADVIPEILAYKNLHLLLKTLVLWHNHILGGNDPFPKRLLDNVRVREHNVSGDLLRPEIKFAHYPKISFRYTPSWEKELKLQKDPCEIYVSRDCVSIHIHKMNGRKRHTRVAAFDSRLLLMWSDLVSSRFLMLTISQLNGPGINKNHIVNKTTLLRLYSLLDKFMQKRGNDGYKFIKMLEPICISAILSHQWLEDQNSCSYNFVNATKEEARDLLQGEDVHFFEELWELIDDQTDQMILEIFGLFRHWGHPIIQPELGLIKVYNHTHANKAIDVTVTSRLGSEMSRTLLKNYYSKNQSWPENTVVPDGVSRILKNCVEENRWPSLEEESKIDGVWNAIQHGKLIEGEGKIPLVQLLKDKSHSCNLEEARRILLREYVPENVKLSRRVLMTALQTEEIDPIQFLHEIDERGFSEADMIIGLKCKEREEKTDGRYFSLMSFNLRLYIVVTEHLLSQYIIPMFSEITMTLSQPELFRLMSSMTKESTNDRMVHYMIHLDYEKWNNHQRYDSTEPIFREIDKAFGFKQVFSMTHKIFEQSWFYYSEEPSMLKVNDNLLPYCWKGQYGGIEGLRQKGWSIVGVLMLRLISKITRQDFKVLLQGDNQVLMLMYKRLCYPQESGYQEESRRLKKQAEGVLDKLCDMSSRIGLRTKREETWFSNRLLIYGKFPILDGATEGILSKRLSRLYALSNDTSPTLGGMMSTVSTLGLTMAQLSSTLEVPIVVCYWYLTELIRDHLDYSPLHRKGLLSLFKDKSVQSPAIKYPFWDPYNRAEQSIVVFDWITRDTSMGGIGGLSPIRFLVRQFVDPVTETLTSLKIGIHSVQSSRYRDVLLAQGHPRYGNTVNYKKLLEDPTCLNLALPSKVQSVVKNLVKEYLVILCRDFIKNQDLRIALETTTDCEEEIIKFLFSWENVLPKVASNIYAASLSGLIEAFTGHFTGTKTIIELTTSNFGRRYGDRLRDTDGKLLCFVLRESNHRSNLSDWVCSYERANQMRHESWQIKRMSGITFPHPLEQFECLKTTSGICPMDNNKDITSEYVILYNCQEVVTNPSKIVSVGPCTPYLGSDTSSKKNILSHCEATTDETPLKRILSVLSEVNWYTAEDGKIAQSLLNLFKSLTDYKIDFEVLKPQVLCTDPDHRYMSERVSAGCFSPLCFTPYTHTSCNSFSLRTFGRGQDNFKVIFQALYIVFQTININCLSMSSRGINAFHLHPSCAGCLVRTDSYQTESETVFDKWPTMANNQRRTSTFYCLSNEMSLYAKPKSLLCSKKHEHIDSDLAQEAAYLHLGVIAASKFTNYSELINPNVRPLEIITGSSINPTRLFDAIAMGLYIIELTVNLKRNEMDPKMYTYPNARRKMINRWLHAHVDNDFSRCLNNNPFLASLVTEGFLCQGGYPIRNGEVGKCVILGTQRLLMDEDFTPNLESFGNNDLYIPYDMTDQVYTETLLACKIICKKIHSLTSELLSDIMDANKERKAKVPWKTSLILLNKVYVEERVYQSSYDWVQFSRSIRRSAGFNVPRARLEQIKYEPAVCIGTTTGYPVNDQMSLCNSPLVTPLCMIKRDFGENTSAFWKLGSIFPHLNNVKDAFICGDGGGGFTKLFIRNYPSSKAIFNTLTDFHNISEQTLGTQIPPALMGLSAEDQSRVINLELSSQSSNDLTDEETLSELNSYIAVNPDVELTHIICDAETTDPALWNIIATNLLSFFSMKSSLTQMLIKTHLSEYYIGQVEGFLLKAEPVCNVSILRSPYSTWGKQEVYLLLDKGAPEKSIDVKKIAKSSSFVGLPRDQFYKARGYLDDIKQPIRQSSAVLQNIFSQIVRALKLKANLAINWRSLSHQLRTITGLYHTLHFSYISTRVKNIGGHMLTKEQAISENEWEKMIGFKLSFDIVLSVLYDSPEHYDKLVALYNSTNLEVISVTGKGGKDSWFVKTSPMCHYTPQKGAKIGNLIVRYISLFMRVNKIPNRQKLVKLFESTRITAQHLQDFCENGTVWGQLMRKRQTMSTYQSRD